jgi:transcriptional regulator GlxA family with amidase domain
MALPQAVRDSETSNQAIFSNLLDKQVLKRLAYYARAADALAYACERLPEVMRLDHVAAHVNMTSPAFSRYFAEKIGLTFSEAFKTLRIERALRELERHDCSIEALAYRSGYHSGCSFTRAFKEVLGQTPSEYRRRFLA